MIKIAFAFVAVLATGACGGKKQTADCASAVDNAMKISSSEIKDSATAAKIKDISLTRCREDKWSNDALACIAAAKTSGDLGTCEQKQTPEQRDKLKKAIEAMVVDTGSAGSADLGGSGSDTNAGGSGSAGSGSATGSAGSGSAAGSGGMGSGSATGSAAK